ncbi:retrovirus-related pol polyprotein from transposon TNT 1-94 [Tanacetum coccineum]
MSGTQDENPPPPPPQETQQTPTQQTPHTVSTIKLPILKKGEYDIWAMKMEHYLAHTDYPIWEVIQNGNGPVSVTTDTSGQIKILPPKTAEEIVARERERKARTTLLMAIPEDHLAKFHKMTDAKEMWNAIKSRFGGNDKSKKMQNQLEIHGAGVSTEDANQKFLRSLPFAWLQVSLIMRNKPGMDSLNFDDLRCESVLTKPQAEFPKLDYGLVVLTSQQGEDLIDCIHKAVEFLSVVASMFPPSNNQLRTSSTPRNQATIQDGRVTVQQTQGRQTQSFTSTGNRGIATTLKGNYAATQPRVVKCSNCQGEGHMVRQCTQPKRPRNDAWFKEKLMLVEAQKAGQILDEEKLAFLVDLGIEEALVAQKMIPQNSAFQTKDLDAYDSDCDDISSAKAVLMANLSSCDSDVLSEESQDAGIQDMNSFAPNDLLILSFVEQMTYNLANLDKENQTNKIVNESLTAELERYKERALGYQNPFHFKKDQRVKPTLYDGSVIAKEHDVIFVIDDEETLILEEESRSKMLDKQNDPISIKLKINISPVDYSKLNKIKEDFGKRFVTQKELFAEQAFWLKHSNYNPNTFVKSHTPIRIEAPSELPRVSLVNESLKKLKYQLVSFDKVVKKRTTYDAITAAQSQENDTVIRKLKDRINPLSGKDSVENVKKDIDEIETINIELEHNIEPISHRLKNNRDAHEVYLEKTIENTNTLRGLELLVNVSKTCPSLTKSCEKLVAVTPMNKDKKVRFAEPVISSSNIPKQADSLKTKDSNKPLLTSTGVNLTTSASGSKPSGNTKNN